MASRGASGVRRGARRRGARVASGRGLRGYPDLGPSMGPRGATPRFECVAFGDVPPRAESLRREGKEQPPGRVWLCDRETSTLARGGLRQPPKRQCCWHRRPYISPWRRLCPLDVRAVKRARSWLGAKPTCVFKYSAENCLGDSGYGSLAAPCQTCIGCDHSDVPTSRPTLPASPSWACLPAVRLRL